MRMQLKHRRRARGAHRALDSGGHRLGLAGADRDEQQVAGAQDRAEALGENVPRDLVSRAEVTRVVVPGEIGQRLDPRQ